MYKKMIVILAVLILYGCAGQNEPEVSERDNQEVIQTIEVLKTQIELLESQNEELDMRVDRLFYEIDKKDNQIDVLENRIDDMRHESDSFYSATYRDYMTSFTYDTVRALEHFEAHYGIVSTYDEVEKIMEVIPVEFVYINDFERIDQLNIDQEATPRMGDVFVYVNYDSVVSYTLSEYFKLHVYDWQESGELMEKSLKAELSETYDNDQIYLFSLIDGNLIRMAEYYWN